MYVHSKVVADTLGFANFGIEVKEVSVYFSESDNLFEQYFDVYVNGEVKHSRLDARGVIRALMVYINGITNQLENNGLEVRGG